MNGFVYRLSYSTDFAYRETPFAIRKMTCVSQDSHKAFLAIVQRAVAQIPDNLVALDSVSRPLGIAEYRLNTSIQSIDEDRELATVNPQLTVRTKATQAGSHALGRCISAFNSLEFEGVTTQARLNEPAIDQTRLLTEERNIKKFKEGEQ
jgi:hypothetical protein